jgi:hypothetical protein
MHPAKAKVQSLGFRVWELEVQEFGVFESIEED